MKGKKFTASYSGGKDSILSLYRCIQMGMEPVGLVITYNTEQNRSWFHGIPECLLKQVSQSLNIPLSCIYTSGPDYEDRFREEMQRQKEKGAEFCVFGDIDIANHLAWDQEICRPSGLKPYFPLWQEDRKKLVQEFIDAGFTAHLTVVDTNRLSEKHLGLVLSRETMLSIEKEGADVCGENGEYHTFVSDGPIFHHPISFSFGKKILRDHHAILPLEKGRE